MTAHFNHINIMKTPATTNEQHSRVLHAAYQAWMNAAGLRQARLRNKRFAYGDQWGDLVKDHQGRVMTEGEHLAHQGCESITNNLIRQLIKTIIGRFRTQYIKRDDKAVTPLTAVSQDNELDELDSRALEEFLISGCCIQRIDVTREPGENSRVIVDNVNINKLFINSLNDTRAWDCELIGQLHDMNIAQLLRRVARGNRRKAAWVRRLYTDNADSRIADFTTHLGADTQQGSGFWHASDGKSVDSREPRSHRVPQPPRRDPHCRACKCRTPDEKQPRHHHPMGHHHRVALPMVQPHGRPARRV